jgi:hypothetical protein
VVQFGDVSVNASTPSITMGSAPVNGNLLVAIGFCNSAMSWGSGWSGVYSNTSGAWNAYIAYKIAGAGESTAQTPVTGGSGYTSIAIWEVHGQNASPLAGYSGGTPSSTVVALTDAVPVMTSSVWFAALAQNESTTAFARAWGAAVVDDTQPSGSGIRVAYGHSDSNSAVYVMGAGPVGFNVVKQMWVLITA